MRVKKWDNGVVREVMDMGLQEASGWRRKSVRENRDIRKFFFFCVFKLESSRRQGIRHTRKRTGLAILIEAESRALGCKDDAVLLGDHTGVCDEGFPAVATHLVVEGEGPVDVVVDGASGHEPVGSRGDVADLVAGEAAWTEHKALDTLELVERLDELFREEPAEVDADDDGNERLFLLLHLLTVTCSTTPRFSRGGVGIVLLLLLDEAGADLVVEGRERGCDKLGAGRSSSCACCVPLCAAAAVLGCPQGPACREGRSRGARGLCGTEARGLAAAEGLGVAELGADPAGEPVARLEDVAGDGGGVGEVAQVGEVDLGVAVGHADLERGVHRGERRAEVALAAAHVKDDRARVVAAAELRDELLDAQRDRVRLVHLLLEPAVVQQRPPVRRVAVRKHKRLPRPRRNVRELLALSARRCVRDHTCCALLRRRCLCVRTALPHKVHLDPRARVPPPRPLPRRCIHNPPLPGLLVHNCLHSLLFLLLLLFLHLLFSFLSVTHRVHTRILTLFFLVSFFTDFHPEDLGKEKKKGR